MKSESLNLNLFNNSGVSNGSNFWINISWDSDRNPSMEDCRKVVRLDQERQKIVSTYRCALNLKRQIGAFTLLEHIPVI